MDTKRPPVATELEDLAERVTALETTTQNGRKI